MEIRQILRAASGWLELGMPSDALVELEGLDAETRGQRGALELRLAAQMMKEDWKEASETGISLCRMAIDEPEHFVNVAFCLHEIGKTEDAKKWLQSGPERLSDVPVFHYNMACYLWTLGEKERAKNHLARAVEMDENFKETAQHDKDLIGIDL
ncbi:MAG: tetratricopeptide repeat protein [Akkermansiaceae bacterium]